LSRGQAAPAGGSFEREVTGCGHGVHSERTQYSKKPPRTEQKKEAASQQAQNKNIKQKKRQKSGTALRKNEPGGRNKKKKNQSISVRTQLEARKWEKKKAGSCRDQMATKENAVKGGVPPEAT